MREHIKYDAISLNIFKNYINLQTVTKIPPDRVALIFDEQATSETHYVSVFTTSLSNNVNGFNEVWLAISPLEDETIQDAYEHIRFLHFFICFLQDND